MHSRCQLPLPAAGAATQSAPPARRRPLATVVIGGLITSTVLTLIVLPVVYEWLEERWPVWAAAFRRRRTGGANRALDNTA